MQKEVLEILNKFLSDDHNSIKELLMHRVPCTKKISDDPNIVVHDYDEDGIVKVGMLGIINGILKLSGELPIVAIIELDGTISSFESFDDKSSL